MISEQRAHRFIGLLFALFVTAGVAAVPLGFALHAKYVTRGYASITGPLYFGAGLLAFAILNLIAGSIWRAGHPPVRRANTPAIFWLSISAMSLVGGYLLWHGLSNWLAQQ